MVDATHAILLLALIGAPLDNFLFGPHHEGLRCCPGKQWEWMIWVTLRRCIAEKAACVRAKIRGGACTASSRWQQRMWVVCKPPCVVNHAIVVIDSSCAKVFAPSLASSS